jgi:two-component system LytT family response regulator
MTVSVMIVDDEPLARRNLEVMLATEDCFEIVHSVGDPRKAMSILETESPDLVFLDIKMPGLSGMELLHQLSETLTALPYFILVTAYDQHAVEAFQWHALDYLLKPFDEERLHQALVFAAERLHQDRQGRALRALLAESAKPRLHIAENGSIRLLDLEDIRWAEVADHFIVIHTGWERLIIRKSMRELEVDLAAAAFVRIHRGTLVNLNHVSGLDTHLVGGAHLQLKDGTRLAVGRRRLAGVKRALRTAHPAPLKTRH